MKEDSKCIKLIVIEIMSRFNFIVSCVVWNQFEDMVLLVIDKDDIKMFFNL